MYSAEEEKVSLLKCRSPLSIGRQPKLPLKPSKIYIGWQRRNFVTYLCQLIFATILLVKLWEMSVTVIALKHALLVSMDILLNQLIQFYSINTTRLRRLTQRIMSCYIHLYPQNGDYIVTVDSVTSLYPVYCKGSDNEQCSVLNLLLICIFCGLL